MASLNHHPYLAEVLEKLVTNINSEEIRRKQKDTNTNRNRKQKQQQIDKENRIRTQQRRQPEETNYQQNNEKNMKIIL